MIRNQEISATELRVLLCLRCYNPSFPSLTRLQKDSSLSRATVVRAVKNLSKAGLIKVTKKGNSLRKHNFYEFDDEKISYKSKPVQFNGDTSQVQNLNSNTTNKSKKNIEIDSSDNRGVASLFDEGEDEWIVQRMNF